MVKHFRIGWHRLHTTNTQLSAWRMPKMPIGAIESKSLVFNCFCTTFLLSLLNSSIRPIILHFISDPYALHVAVLGYYLPVFEPPANQFFLPISHEQTHRDNVCVRILRWCVDFQRQNIKNNENIIIIWQHTNDSIQNVPFSKLSICSLVNDVRFRCNFRFKRKRNWLSSSPDELPPASELPSDVLSCEFACDGIWCRPSPANSSVCTQWETTKKINYKEILHIIEGFGTEFLRTLFDYYLNTWNEI